MTPLDWNPKSLPIQTTDGPEQIFVQNADVSFGERRMVKRVKIGGINHAISFST